MPGVGMRGREGRGKGDEESQCPDLHKTGKFWQDMG